RVGRAGREGVAVTLAEPREHRMLKSVELVTGRRIEMEKVPTVADLRARRLEMTRAALQEALMGDELERFRVVVESLSDEFDPVEIALAGVKLAHDATAGDETEEEDIAEVVLYPDRGSRPAARVAPGGRARTGGMTRLY